MKPCDLDARRAQFRYMLYAERVTRILCRRSGCVDGFEWGGSRRPGWHRSPPLPFHSKVHKGAGWCRVCGQPIYGGGSFRSFAGEQSKRLTWHTVCTSAYFLMTKPADYVHLFVLGQDGRCAITGDPIGPPAREFVSYAEVDHEVPLFRVAREHAAEPWYELIRFWGSGNLRALTRSAHLQKCQDEARERAGYRITAAGQEALL